MTLGMDASSVFSEMCRASFLQDEVSKKMIFFYLTTYAQDNLDLAIMAVNTFKKDCKHSSGRVRGLALRNLCSFRSADYVNIVLPAIRELLEDFQPYVRKTAIMGILKVFYYDPTVIFSDTALINRLSLLIKDTDPQVSVNALSVLDQVLISEGGMPLNKQLFKYILDRLPEFSSWQQSTVLDLLFRYNPETPEDGLDIVNTLWPKLRLSSTPLVLGSIKLILKFTKGNKSLYPSVVEKLKEPLITLMETGSSHETMFICLTHIEYVIAHLKGKAKYEADFKYFYCRGDEPTYIKKIKVKIMGMLANENNLGDMLNELNQYAIENDPEIARKAVTTVAEIAIRQPQVSKALLCNLVAIYRSDRDNICGETLSAISLILRQNPKLFIQVGPFLLQKRFKIKESSALQSFMWILGTFALQIDEGPYILEEFLQHEDKFSSLADTTKDVLLSQLVQTFLKRPAQTIKVLGRAFKLILSDESSSVKLLDHAAFYYRALQANPQDVRKGFNAMQIDMAKLILDETNEMAAQADQQFNSMALIYGRQQSKFTKNYQYFLTMRNKQLGLINPNAQQYEQLDENALDVISNTPSEQKIAFNAASIIYIDSDSLMAESSLVSEEFSDIWNNLPSHSQTNLALRAGHQLDQESVEQLFKLWKIMTIASGQQDDTLKYYMYGRMMGGNASSQSHDDVICLEVLVDVVKNRLEMTVKAATDSMAQAMVSYIIQFMRINEFVD